MSKAIILKNIKKRAMGASESSRNIVYRNLSENNVLSEINYSTKYLQEKIALTRKKLCFYGSENYGW